MKTMRIGIICNNRMAIPAIQQLIASRSLAGIGIPITNHDMVDECRHILNGSGIAVHIIERETLFENMDQWIHTIEADAIWMMTFPWKIPASLLEKFPEKFFNFHYGILPGMRGADPVFESIRSQKKEAGITVHKVTEGLDKGPIVFQQAILLNEQTTHGLLCAQLAMLGAQVCTVLLPLISDPKKLTFQPQSEDKAKYYPRPGLKDVAINWQQMDSKEISALARACNPWNKGAYTSVKGWNIRLCGLSFIHHEYPENFSPGTIVRADEEGVVVACKDKKYLKIDTIYSEEGFFEGKKLMQFGIIAGDQLMNVI
jgi:methionyl-tRNA formyltransferase